MIKRLTKKQSGGVFGFGKKKAVEHTDEQNIEHPVKKTGNRFLSLFRSKPVAKKTNQVATTANNKSNLFNTLHNLSQRKISQARAGKTVHRNAIDAAKTALLPRVENAQRRASVQIIRKQALKQTSNEKRLQSRKQTASLNRLSSLAEENKRTRYRKFRNAVGTKATKAKEYAKRKLSTIKKTLKKIPEYIKTKIKNFTNKLKHEIKTFKDKLKTPEEKDEFDHSLMLSLSKNEVTGELQNANNQERPKKSNHTGSANSNGFKNADYKNARNS